jgi:hypothetical protein
MTSSSRSWIPERAKYSDLYPTLRQVTLACQIPGPLIA